MSASQTAAASTESDENGLRKRNAATVATLLEAMPYVQRFSGATVVVKYGGAAMTTPGLQEEVARDIVLLRLIGMRPIVVHGGGPQVSQMMRRLGLEPRFVRGHRVTDEQTIEVARMVLTGKVNKDIVGLIHRHGGTAVGLSGEDGRMLLAEPLRHRDERGREVDIGFVGRIRRVDAAVLELIAASAVPVVASIGSDERGTAYNINADTVAAAVAAELQAEKLLLLSDVPGILRRPPADGRSSAEGTMSDVIAECRLADLEELEASGAVSGGMLPKLAAVRSALEGGVGSAHVVDGRVEHALLLEVLTDAGCGTKVVR